MNRFELARKVHNTHGFQSVAQVAEKAEVTKSLIEDLERTKVKQRGVDYRKVAALASHYGVSMDYLAGLSNCATLDTSTQAVCAATGLSERAAQRLIDLRNVNRTNTPKELDALSRFLEDPKIFDFMTWLRVCLNPEEDIMYAAQIEVYRQSGCDTSDPAIKERARDASLRDALFMVQETCRKIIEDMKKE